MQHFFHCGPLLVRSLPRIHSLTAPLEPVLSVLLVWVSLMLLYGKCASCFYL